MSFSFFTRVLAFSGLAVTSVVSSTSHSRLHFLSVLIAFAESFTFSTRPVNGLRIRRLKRFGRKVLLVALSEKGRLFPLLVCFPRRAQRRAMVYLISFLAV